MILIIPNHLLHSIDFKIMKFDSVKNLIVLTLKTSIIITTFFNTILAKTLKYYDRELIDLEIISKDTTKPPYKLTCKFKAFNQSFILDLHRLRGDESSFYDASIENYEIDSIEINKKLNMKSNYRALLILDKQLNAQDIFFRLNFMQDDYSQVQYDILPIINNNIYPKKYFIYKLETFENYNEGPKITLNYNLVILNEYDIYKEYQNTSLDFNYFYKIIFNTVFRELNNLFGDFFYFKYEINVINNKETKSYINASSYLASYLDEANEYFYEFYKNSSIKIANVIVMTTRQFEDEALFSYKNLSVCDSKRFTSVFVNRLNFSEFYETILETRKPDGIYLEWIKLKENLKLVIVESLGVTKSTKESMVIELIKILLNKNFPASCFKN